MPSLRQTSAVIYLFVAAALAAAGNPDQPAIRLNISRDIQSRMSPLAFRLTAAPYRSPDVLVAAPGCPHCWQSISQWLTSPARYAGVLLTSLGEIDQIPLAVINSHLLSFPADSRPEHLRRVLELYLANPRGYLQDPLALQTALLANDPVPQVDPEQATYSVRARTEAQRHIADSRGLLQEAKLASVPAVFAER